MDRARAIRKMVRVSPKKGRLAAGLIRGKSVEDAIMQLTVSPMKASHFLLKTLKSAVANAENMYDAKREELNVVEVRIDDGPHFKRVKARSRGRRSPILKRTSHFTVVVGS